MKGVWYATEVDTAAHQKAMHIVPAGKYQALAVSPLASGRLNPPDIALFYATPGAMMYFINGLQYTGYTRFMGGSSYTDADGNLRRARDNNTTMLFLWTSI